MNRRILVITVNIITCMFIISHCCFCSVNLKQLQRKFYLFYLLNYEWWLTFNIPSMSKLKRSSLPKVSIASATLNMISMPSDRNTSIILQASGKERAVVNNVRNQLDAYMDVWKLWDWKCKWRSGSASETKFSNWYMHTPSSAILGLNMSRIRYSCIIRTRTANASSSGIYKRK